MPVIIQPANTLLKNQLPAQPALQGSVQQDPVDWNTTYPTAAKANSKGAPRPATTPGRNGTGSSADYGTLPEVAANPADDVTFGLGMPVVIRPVYTPVKS